MGRQLDRAPGERYRGPEAPRGGPGTPGTGSARGRQSPAGPIARAGIATIVGAVGLVVVGGLLASTAGLLFVAGATGAAVGLLLARAAVPPGGLEAGISRASAGRLAIGLAVVAVALGGFGTWLFARSEGGTLGPLDYLWQTFGLLVPAELLVAGVAAAWGASAGPVQRG